MKTETKYQALLAQLIEIDSTTGHEAAIGDALFAFVMTNFDCDTVELQQVDGGRRNLVMAKGNGGAIHLTSHIDTVPFMAPFDMTSDGSITGTGACDAKGQVVTQLWAVERAIAAGLRNFCCFFVVGEEVDSVGAKAAMGHHLTGGAAVLNGEPTNGKFVRRSYGVVDMNLLSSGTKAHSSLAPLDSAIHKLITALGPVLDLEADDFLVNIGLLDGGSAPNVSSDRASARLCIRSPLPAASVADVVRGALTEGCTASVTTAADPVEFWVPTHADEPIDVTFGCDAGEYVGHYEKVLMYGPGDIADAHSINEKVSFSDIRDCSRVISEMLLASEQAERP